LSSSRKFKVAGLRVDSGLKHYRNDKGEGLCFQCRPLTCRIVTVLPCPFSCHSRARGNPEGRVLSLYVVQLLKIQSILYIQNGSGINYFTYNAFFVFSMPDALRRIRYIPELIPSARAFQKTVCSPASLCSSSNVATSRPRRSNTRRHTFCR